MTMLEALLLGVLQGLTEFLPVSSSGHLALAEHFLGVDDPGVTFEVFVHFGTALAVLWFFRTRVWSILRSLAGWARRGEYDPDEARLALHLAIGTVPAAVIGLSLEGFVSGLFESPAVVSIMLFVTGFVLWMTRNVASGPRAKETTRDAVLIGLAQAAAIVPGISRSGATIATGIGLRLDRRRAAEFAFLLSIPVILGAALKEVAGLGSVAPEMMRITFVGTVAAFASAIPAIALLMKMVTVGRFHRFAYYCWGAGGAGLLFALLRG